MAQISPKVYGKDLQKEIFPDNAFYTKGMKDEAASNATAVQIPIAGNIGKAKTGNPQLPVAIGEREDDVKEYPLIQVYAEPVLVQREEDIVLSYNKQQDIVRVQGEAMSTAMADMTAYKWGADNTNFIIGTTGAARATTLVGATGTRKAITKDDLIKVRQLFMRQNIRDINGIIALLTPDQYADILKIADFTDYEKTGVTSKLIEGIVGRVCGFDIMVRWNADLGSIGLSYNKAATAKVDNDAITADCNASAMFFHPAYVRYAEAFPEVIINRKPAGYLGATIIESVVRYGATQNRKDGRGVVSLVETWVS